MKSTSNTQSAIPTVLTSWFPRSQNLADVVQFARPALRRPGLPNRWKPADRIAMIAPLKAVSR